MVQGVRSFVLVTVGLVLLALSNHQGSFRSPKFSSSVSPSLRCQEVLKIALWGMSKHGGSTLGKLDDAKTAEKALQLFVEKIDPYKILFTNAEVDSFKATGRKKWQSLIHDQSCGYFSAWLESTYPRTTKRLARTVQEGSFAESMILPKSKKEFTFTKPKTWAADESELKARVIRVGLEILKSTPKSVLSAYKGKLADLVESSLEESAIPEVNASSTVLAKSILGTFDPYTTYLSSSEFEDFYSDLSGGTSGIGIRVRKVPSGLLVEEVLKDSAASRSGKIKKDDVITRVDDVPTDALSYTEAKRLLKGADGTQVKLELRAGDAGPKRLELTRKHFDFEEAKISAKKINSVEVVSIPGFYGGVGFTAEGSDVKSSAEDLRQILEELNQKETKPQALVLDLRGNPGGFLEEAVSMASFFVGSQPVVGVVEKEQTRVLKEELQTPLYDGKLVVLVDSGTASAAEVLAGALSDLQRAIIVGTPRTYGKGTVQKLFSLDEELLEIGLTQTKGNGVLKLTTSIFYSPMGHSPANGGIKSDLTLPSALMASKEDYGTAPSMAVEEEKPFLDEETVLQLKLKQEMNKGLIDSLKELSASRLKNEPPKMAEDRALVEASSIAADLAKTGNPAF